MHYRTIQLVAVLLMLTAMGVHAVPTGHQSAATPSLPHDDDASYGDGAAARLNAVEEMYDEPATSETSDLYGTVPSGLPAPVKPLNNNTTTPSTSTTTTAKSPTTSLKSNSGRTDQESKADYPDTSISPHKPASDTSTQSPSKSYASIDADDYDDTTPIESRSASKPTITTKPYARPTPITPTPSAYVPSPAPTPAPTAPSLSPRSSAASGYTTCGTFQHGDLDCEGDGYRQCVNGGWISLKCALGTVCRTVDSSARCVHDPNRPVVTTATPYPEEQAKATAVADGGESTPNYSDSALPKLHRPNDASGKLMAYGSSDERDELPNAGGDIEFDDMDSNPVNYR